MWTHSFEFRWLLCKHKSIFSLFPLHWIFSCAFLFYFHHSVAISCQLDLYLCLCQHFSVLTLIALNFVASILEELLPATAQSIHYETFMSWIDWLFTFLLSSHTSKSIWSKEINKNANTRLGNIFYKSNREALNSNEIGVVVAMEMCNFCWRWKVFAQHLNYFSANEIILVYWCIFNVQKPIIERVYSDQRIKLLDSREKSTSFWLQIFSYSWSRNNYYDKYWKCEE